MITKESGDTKMILTDSKIEEMADKICELVVKSVNAYHDKHSLDAEAIEPCDVCPFTEYCAKGQTGFTEFFKQEVNK